MKPYYQDNHATIYHCDCLEIMDDLEFDVIVTDPPYGIGWRSGGMPSNYNPNGPNLRREVFVSGDKTIEQRDRMLALIPAETPTVIFGSWKAPRPERTTRVLIWNKAGANPGPINHPWWTAHEDIYLSGKGWTGDPTRSVLTTNENRSFAARMSGHPTSKPLELMGLLVGKCPPGTILDPFMGSGTTLRAAKDLSRKAIGIEIEERYCEIAARRMGQEVLAL